MKTAVHGKSSSPLMKRGRSGTSAAADLVPVRIQRRLLIAFSPSPSTGVVTAGVK